jgi:uncharacterized protein
MRPLLTFFSLTYIVSWSLWIIAGWLLGADAAPSSMIASVSALILLTGTFAPSLVALALTARADGHAGTTTLLGRIARVPVEVRWYMFAATFMAAIKLTVAVAHRLVAGRWPPFGDTPWYIMAIATIVSTPVQAGEELGWRGYALPRLSARFGLPAASVVLGVIWACWHLPLFFAPIGDNVGQSFPVYMLAVTAISVAMAWLYWRTDGSLLLTMLMHAASNNTAGIVHSVPMSGSDPFTLRPSLIAWLTAAILWVPATYFLIRLRAAPRQGSWATSIGPGQSLDVQAAHQR